MKKRAISLTLGADNLLWLRGQALAAGRRSISDFLERTISEARSNGNVPARSVVGTVRIGDDDPGLRKADAAVSALFAASLGRRTRRRERA